MSKVRAISGAADQVFSSLSNGLIIYAVGSDLADNGGNLDRNAIKPGTDVGFRLWDVPARRQPPPPPKPEDGP